MIYVAFRFLKRRKTWTVLVLLVLAVWLGLSRFYNENEVVYFDRNGEEISLFTSLKFWLKGDLEGGITYVSVQNPKVVSSYHKSPMPTLEDVKRDIHRLDPDLKLLFHESVDRQAMIALFWNEKAQKALVYTFPSARIYAEHETSAPDLTKAFSRHNANIQISDLIFFYEPDKGLSSFYKQTKKRSHRIQGANLVTLDPKHGPLNSWGFGTSIDADKDAKLTFFIGYDQSEKRWRTYEFRIQHADARSRLDWQMQEFDYR